MNAIRSKLHITQIYIQVAEAWYVWIHPFFFRLIAILLGLFSLAIIWSESVFVFSKDFSIFALILHGNITYSTQQVIVLAHKSVKKKKTIDGFVVVRFHHDCHLHVLLHLLYTS